MKKAAPKKAKKPAPPPPPETYEDFLALARHDYYHGPLAMAERGYDGGEPTWRYAVGDLVVCGRRNYGLPFRVEEVLEDGRVYHLSYDHFDEGEWVGTGDQRERQRIPRGRRPLLSVWYETLPFGGRPQGLVLGTDRHRFINYSQQALESLVHSLRWRGINDTPDFQRDYVWTLDDKRRLVASIFDGADIGKFIMQSHEWPVNALTIIDGKQRCRAILDFMEGRFDFKGYTWATLSWHDRYTFTNLMVQVAEFREGELVKRSDVLYLFLQVNRGGVPQSDEHIARVRRLYEEAVAQERAEGGPS